MIKATKSEWTKRAFYWIESRLIFPRKFRKIQVQETPIKKDHSVLLLMNHFSWWDGFLGSYLAYRYLGKSYHVMVQEDQLTKHWYFRYKGAFSIRKNSKEILDSLQYTSEVLKNPENMVLIFPEGRLQSMHTDEIKVEKGVTKLIRLLPEKCQVMYCSAVIDYLESFKPTVHMHLHDLGVPDELAETDLSTTLSELHLQTKRSRIRK